MGLGSWKVVRKGDALVEVQFPAGMKITGSKLDIEDLYDAIHRYKVIKAGEIKPESNDKGKITIKCCSGNTAIA